METNENITETNEEKFKQAWLAYLADDNGFTWQRWDKLKQVMFASGKSSEEVEDLMNEAEGKGKYAPPIAPSTFSKIFPTACIYGQAEYEMIAQNVMAILKRTGDNFRLLSWEEYKRERKVDGNFTEREKKYFDKVVGSCEAEKQARIFSGEWLKA